MGHASFLRRLLGRATDQRFDVSSRGTRSSSPRLLPGQISVSGWGRSSANNNSTALRGVRSAEESTISWKEREKKQRVITKGTESDHRNGLLHPALVRLGVAGVYWEGNTACPAKLLANNCS